MNWLTNDTLNTLYVIIKIVTYCLYLFFTDNQSNPAWAQCKTYAEGYGFSYYF